MFSKSHLAAAALIAPALVSGQTDLPGRCPKIVGGWEDLGKGKLDLNKIKGQWRNVYDSHEHTENYDCLAIKMEDFEENKNATKVHLTQGSLAPLNSHDPALDRFVVYDDNVVLIFNHATDSSMSSMYDKHEGEFNKEEYLKQFAMDHYSDEAIEAMSDDERALYEMEKKEKTEAIAEVEAILKDYDPYKNGMTVLDTDYDNFLMLYHCREDEYDDEDLADMKEAHLEVRTEQIEKANFLKMKLADNQEFKQIQAQIDASLEGQPLSQDDMVLELASLADLDGSFHEHFPHSSPNIRQWEKMRRFYGTKEHKAEDLHHEVHKVTHTFQASIFSRDPSTLTDAKFSELQEQLHKQIPEFNFENSHKRIPHPADLCPEGDIFKSKGAVSYEEAMEKELVNDNVLGGFHGQEREEKQVADKPLHEESHMKDEL